MSANSIPIHWAADEWQGMCTRLFKLIRPRLVAFFFAVYLVALLAMTPLSWLRQFFEPALQSAGIRLEQVDGSLWSGSARLQAPQVPALQLGWHARPLSLFMLRLPFDIQVSNASLDVTGRLDIKLTGASVKSLSGYVDDTAFAPIASAYGADVQGRLRLDDVALSAGWRGALGELGGSLSWSGGPVSVPFGSQVQTFQIPQMQGQLNSDDARWQALVLAMDETPLIDAQLSRDGVGSLSVKRALAERLNLAIPAGRDTLFDISQRVFE
ncbi:type II secretion system protein N [Saccharospirillum mangrovi]|uniref:type II secretion system protein N n=1 Tax=Saccharospirillum mangrovi TaxID=2161747 RepID=UPI001300AE54|nr:type II secretion system protein N [Saccharospirillum mangrovi]